VFPARARILRPAGLACAGALALLAPASIPGAPGAAPHPAVSANRAAVSVPHAAAALPRPAHVVVVIEENHSDSQIIGNSSAPYINSLAAQGASFSNSHAVTHPSEPNYLALFSGSTQGVTDDSCPHTFSAANLGSELAGAGFTFTGYSESMPSDGYTGCTSGEYARKHNPWSDFSNVPAASNRTLAAFPADFASLPTVSVVVPNLADDMHDGTVAQGDSWLQAHIDSYAQWAKSSNSLLIVTWDENDGSSGNQIPAIIVGAGVTPGSYSENISHYNVLRTIEDMYGLPYAGASASATPITDIFG
jgi:phospholipase C